jgi:hypothetical protein
MSLKNRLKKLEIQTGVNSKICECYQQRNVEIYQADLTEDSDSSEPVLIGESIPKACLNCRKQIEKQQIILQICDQSTKERFPYVI